MEEIVQDTATLSLFPEELGESGIREKRKVYLPKALALKNVTELPSCQPCHLAQVSKPDRKKDNGVFLTRGREKRVVHLGKGWIGSFLLPVHLAWN